MERLGGHTDAGRAGGRSIPIIFFFSKSFAVEMPRRTYRRRPRRLRRRMRKMRVPRNRLLKYVKPDGQHSIKCVKMAPFVVQPYGAGQAAYMAANWCAGQGQLNALGFWNASRNLSYDT